MGFTRTIKQIFKRSSTHPKPPGRQANTQDSPARLQYSGIAIFKEDKLVDWLNETESKGFNFTQGKVKNSVGSVECRKGGEAVYELVRTNAKIKGKVVKGKPQISVEIYAEGNIGEAQCDLDLANPQSIHDLELRAEKRIEQIVEAALKKAKKYKVDIFGFGEAIHRTNPAAWQGMKKNWEEEWFPELRVDVHVDARIRRTGTISNSIVHEIKKGS
jgi:spore germination protein KC